MSFSIGLFVSPPMVRENRIVSFITVLDDGLRRPRDCLAEIKQGHPDEQTPYSSFAPLQIAPQTLAVIIQRLPLCNPPSRSHRSTEKA